MQEKESKILHISSGTIVKVFVIGIFFYLLYLLRDFVLVIATAVVIATAIEPFTARLERYKIPRVAAVVLIYALVISLFGGVIYFFVPPLIDEAVKLDRTYNFFSLFTEYARNWGIFSVSPGGADITTMATMDVGIKQSLVDLKHSISENPEQLFQTFSTVFGGFLSFIIMIVVSFYLAVQKNGITDFLKIVTPLKHQKYVVGLWQRSQVKIGLWMQGQLLLGLLIGIFVYLGLNILGLHFALTLALLAMLFELIPIFGPILAAIPAIMLAFTGGLGFAEPGLTSALIVTGFYLLIQQFENHLIYPLVVQKVVGVSPILVILALVIGGKLAGVLGIILAVPVAAALMEFANDIQKEKQVAQ